MSADLHPGGVPARPLPGSQGPRRIVQGFRTVRAAGFGEVLRGVSLTPGSRG